MPRSPTRRAATPPRRATSSSPGRTRSPTSGRSFGYLTGLPEVSNTNVGAWGISYGGGQTWNGLAAGIPYKAAEVVETWTDLYTALWPQDVAKSGIVLGFAKSIEARSPLIAANETDAVRSTNLGTIRALVAPRSATPSSPRSRRRRTCSRAVSTTPSTSPRPRTASTGSAGRSTSTSGSSVTRRRPSRARTSRT